MDFKKKTFWLDKWNGVAKGGYYFRSFDLNVFMKKLEEENPKQTVVGLEFEDGNVNVIVEASESDVKDLKNLTKDGSGQL